MTAAVALAYLPIRALPDLPMLPPTTGQLVYSPVELLPAQGALRLVGAWEARTADRRFGGLSALAIEGGNFLTVGDRGSVARFPQPSAASTTVWIADLRRGPGAWGERWARDAESLTPDPGGRGWWVGYEQSHSLFLYEPRFERSLEGIDLQQDGWGNNRGAEGLLADNGGLLVTAENGREALRISGGRIEKLALAVGADVAEAAVAPDGSAWLLLRSKGLGGIRQSIAPLVRTKLGYRAGTPLPVPKGAFDNYEGMAIEARPGGVWRFWLLTDDGHRFMARTLLVALDYNPPRHDKSPARGAGLSKKRNR
ncbi:MAG TPA: esterase-like activity of phytase family protein [Sphingomicrobium sp.]